MFAMTCGEHQQAVGELSPPYDGSEMDLFPDLSFLDSVQSDFLNNGFDELASLPPIDDDNSEHSDDQTGQAELVPDSQKGIVSPSKNPTLMSTSSKGKSVIKVIVNSSRPRPKDETELVKYLMGKDHNGGPPPILRIIKKTALQANAGYEVTTTTSHQEMKIDSSSTRRPVVKEICTSSSSSSRNVSKSKEMSVIEQLEKDLQDCDPINRNAVAARLNRCRKKNHVESLEESVRHLQTENSELSEQNMCLNSKVSSLETEVDYLKSILANQSSLSSLLSNIQATNLNFHTSMDTVQNISEEDIDNVFQTSSDDDEVDVESCDQSIIPRKRKRTCTSDKNTEQIDNNKARKTSPGISKSRDGEPRMSSRLNEQKKTELKNIQPTAGVCLHVSGKNVSLEFCSHCSRKARSTIQMSMTSGQKQV